MSEAGLATLWEPSLHQNEAIGLRFLEEAVNNVFTARQLRARSEPALIAAVGLDSRKRDRASKLLTAKLADPALPFSNKVDTAFVALELEDRPGRATDECVEVIIQALAANDSDDRWPSWIRHLTTSATRLHPDTCSRVLVSTIERGKDPQKSLQLAQSLVSVSARMEPVQAVHALSFALARETDTNFAWGTATQLASIAKRLKLPLSADIRSECTRVMVSALLAGKTLGDVPQIVSDLSGELTSAEATQIAGVISASVANTDDYGNLNFLASLSNQIQPGGSNRLVTNRALELATDLMKSKKSEDREKLAYALATIASRLDLAERREEANSIIQSLRTAYATEKSTEARGALVWGLAPLSERLGPADAVRICDPLADDLKKAIQSETSDKGKYSLFLGLAATALRLAPKQAIQTTRFLAARMEREGDWARAASESSLAGSFYSVCQGLDT